MNQKENQSRTYPLLALKNTTVFPGTIVPIRAMREISVHSIEKAIRERSLLLTVSEKEELSAQGVPFPDRLSRTGTLTRIEKYTGNANEGYNLILMGMERFGVEEIMNTGKGFSATGQTVEDRNDLDSKNADNLILKIRETAKSLLEFFPSNTDTILEQLGAIQDLPLLIHTCLSHLDLEHDDRIGFLETVSLRKRSLMLLEHLEKRIHEFKVKTEVQGRMSARLGKQQREAILREQLRTIQDELGEKSKKGVVDYRQKIREAEMPDEVNRIALDELERMESMGGQSQEVAIIRNYLDLLVALPWKSDSQTVENIDLERSRSILNDDHSGLEEVKKKILQSLAIAKLKKTNRGQIILLAGPPGVGKTSLGQSIARAMNRKFTRVALGGVRDEAEIRGHRRTYVGAMPGRIIQAIKRAGTKDTVMLLDEIDKLGRGIQGDPTAALLEVLDPEQNSTFTDHYLDAPYDLSDIVFIATANNLESIPGPLLDRMEVIELSGYTSNEKNHIARMHLIPKIRNELGLTDEHAFIDDPALSKTIASYTREAGVRDLHRKLNSLFRSVTEKVVSEREPLPIRIGTDVVEDVLGKEKYEFESAEKVAVPGVVTGLAWTPMGGEILFIESGLMPGKGNLILTGQLGEVMQESAQIALSLLRSNLSASVPMGDFENKDIHIHVPAGGIPKDGPSAGITMLSSLASAFLKKPVDPNLGMTGEITLRGSVMPVGGIKEKMIAAHQAGLKRIILSKKNDRDLKELPDEVRNGLEFRFVEKVEELLQEVFGIPQATPMVADSIDASVTSAPLM